MPKNERYHLASQGEKAGVLGRFAKACNANGELLEAIESVDAFIEKLLSLQVVREGHDLREASGRDEHTNTIQSEKKESALGK